MNISRKYSLILFFVLASVSVGFLWIDTGQNLNPTEHDGTMKENTKPVIAMLGDSITRGTDWNMLLNRTDVVNRGIDGDTVPGFLERLEPVIRSRPEICFVMGGINDIARGYGVDGIFQDYVSVLKKLIDAGIKPVVQSTLRVGSDFFESAEINQKIDELNQKLKNYCRESKIEFLDVNRTMSEDDGLISAYTIDGVHLSGEGYRAWADILRTFLKKINY